MILDELQSDLAVAQKARDSVRVDTLRFLLGAIYALQIEKYPPSIGGTLTEQDVLSVIAKQVKTHKESIEMFKQGKRDDLVQRENAEMEILQAYLPAQMATEQVKSILVEIKNANPDADFGTLMKLSMVQLKGKADGSLISQLIKDLG